jgi:hypothetical protein
VWDTDASETIHMYGDPNAHGVHTAVPPQSRQAKIVAEVKPKENKGSRLLGYGGFVKY